MLQELHNELYRAQITDHLDTLFAAITKSRILLSRYRAALSAPPAKWCAHCRKDTHSDNECWSTRAIGVHDAHPAPMQMPTAFAWPKDIAAQATPVAAVAQPVAGWLIEDQDHFPRHRWLRIVDDAMRAYLQWDEDANVATRFARRDDAVHFQKLHIDFCALSIVTGHTFMDAALAASPSCERQDVGGDRG